MTDKEKEKRDLESGDNPEEREKSSGTTESEKKEKKERDLESGDNPEERERTSDK